MNPKRILIVSEAGDLHSDAVAWALRKKRHECEILRTPDFPTLLSLSMHLAQDDPAGRFLMRGPDISRTDFSEPFDAVWLRRPGEAVLPDDMHPGDKEISARQCALVLAGVAPFLDRDGRTFWVNPPASDGVAQQKASQLRSAARAGLAIPETLISNDPEEIRAFLREHGGRVAHKLLRPGSWVVHDESGERIERVFGAYTAAVTEDQLPEDDVLRLCPGIFQPMLEKDFEIRVACLGDFLVALRINSQTQETAATDWRRGQLDIEMDPYELPRDVAEGCRRVLQDLGLVSGSLDFVVAPNGEHIFLEVNPQGQFLFLETRAGLPLLDMFSEFLLAGTRDFTWRDNHEILRFAEYEEHRKQTYRDEMARHVSLRKPLGVPDVEQG